MQHILPHIVASLYVFPRVANTPCWQRHTSFMFSLWPFGIVDVEPASCNALQNPVLMYQVEHTMRIFDQSSHIRFVCRLVGVRVGIAYPPKKCISSNMRRDYYTCRTLYYFKFDTCLLQPTGSKCIGWGTCVSAGSFGDLPVSLRTLLLYTLC